MSKAKTTGKTAKITANEPSAASINQTNLDNPELYFNRELSWLEFNERVLEEAQDRTNPILERVKFLAITASNLDEFFMVRVASLHELVEAEYNQPDPSGMTAAQQISEISKRAHEMTQQQYNCLNRSLFPQLSKENLVFLDYKELNKEQKSFAQHYFDSTLFPILTPMAIDQSRPFPLLTNKSLNVIVELDNPDEEMYAVVQVPSVVSRIMELPSSDSEKKQFIFIEEIIVNHLSKLFNGHKVLGGYMFKITRNADLTIDEEEANDLLDEIEQSIKRRKWGTPVRLEIEKHVPAPILSFLEQALELDNEHIYEISGPLDLTVFMSFSGIKGYDHLRNQPFAPIPSVSFLNQGVFDAIRKQDILVHHPYESFDCVVNFIKTAANDPQVLAIKQTLYRVSGDSPIVHALMQAAENGKQVTVLVELKARFDEENNIIWARKLEKSGCHVIYGLVGLKTHCKLCLVVRKEEDGIRRYLHLGTGNYNDSTAKIYTDHGLFTCKESFGEDVSGLFNVLTGYSIHINWNKISAAPVSLRDTFMKLINNEINNALEGKPASITAKMNSLVDTSIIQTLYKASMAGVKIKLLVRGICCLKPGVEGISENIQVFSIVDRFLEHSRIYIFENNGDNLVYLASADWMPRNLDRRVETAFPVEEESLKNEIIRTMKISLSDTEKLRVLQTNGTYTRVDKRGKTHIHSQAFFYKTAKKHFDIAVEVSEEERFRPILHTDINLLGESDELENIIEEADYEDGAEI